MQKLIFTAAIVFVAFIVGCSKYESENNQAPEESVIQSVDSECELRDDDDPIPILRGTVTDSTTLDSLAGACVKLYTSLDVFVDGMATNSEGFYYFNQLASGSYKLVFSKDGYITKTTPVSIVSTPLYVHAQLVPEP